MSKIAKRFGGRDNAGLRAKIRGVTESHKCGAANAAAVRGLAKSVALTASGLETLKQVAGDYAEVGSFKASCDCDACCAGNLQRLGANG